MKFSCTAEEVARIVKGQLIGDPRREITHVAPIEESEEKSLIFLHSPQYVEKIAASPAKVVLIQSDLAKRAMEVADDARTWIVVENPQAALIALYQQVASPLNLPGGVHPRAYVDETVRHRLDDSVYVGAFAYVSEGCKIGKNVKIFPQVYLGPECEIGDNTILHAGVKVYSRTAIGRHCIVHSGAVIGSDGFGFVAVNGRQQKIPQLGRVIIKDHVEIGANTVIDRATLTATLIEDGVKLDNLIQVAHNVVIGEGTVIAAQSGISGSTRVGAHAMIGGQVGIAGHLKIAERTRIGAKSGVAKSIEGPGQDWLGAPALPAQQTKKIWYVLTRLPEMYRAWSQAVRKNKNQ